MKSVKNKNLKIQFVDLSNESMAFNVLIDEKLVGMAFMVIKTKFHKVEQQKML